MDTSSVAYVLCRIEEDSSLTPVSRHKDMLKGSARLHPEVRTFLEGLVRNVPARTYASLRRGAGGSARKRGARGSSEP